jgi:8-oxo-dGTP diphosphatase
MTLENDDADVALADTGESADREFARLEREYGEFGVTDSETVVPRAVYTDCVRAAENGTLGGARAFLFRNDRVLLVRYEDQPEVWELPGGNTDRGETPDETAAARVREDTGLDCEPSAVHGVHAEQFVLVEGGDPATGLWVFFDADAPDRDPVPGDGVAEAAWFAVEDIPAAVAPEVSRRFD